MVISVRLTQLPNADSPILFTLSEIVTVARLLQLRNASSSILSPLVITTVFKVKVFTELQAIAGIAAVSIAQPLNAPSPILFKLSGIVIVVSLRQPSNT